VEGISGVRTVAAAYHHTLALLDDGTVWTFGINDRGQLGDGTTNHRTRPVQVTGLRGVVAVAAAGGGGEDNPGDYGHSLALLDDGTLWTWGCNDHGELGGGTTDDQLSPERVAGLSGVRHITGGGEVPAFRENPGGGFSLAIHS
jgi:alpha-tubulin suppressor-like RCC1 family protein